MSSALRQRAHSYQRTIGEEERETESALVPVEIGRVNNGLPWVQYGPVSTVARKGPVVNDGMVKRMGIA